MKAKYWQKGESLDYVNKTEKKIEHGDVILLGNRVGIAGDDILPGGTGAVHVTGVFEFVKSGAEEITVGTEVYYAESGVSLVGEVKVGYAVADSSADNAKVFVKINA